MTERSHVHRLPLALDERRPGSRPVYDRLRGDILSLNIAPGSDLDEKSLATLYGVSRTPIREALIRLSQSGLVEFSPARGARVSALILPGVARYLEAIDLLQRALAHTGAIRRLANDLEGLSTAFANFQSVARAIDHSDYQSATSTADAEAEVLRAVADCAHNTYLREAYDKLLVQGQRMLRLPFAYNPKGMGPVQVFATERMAAMGRIADAIRSSDPSLAESEMRGFHHALTARLTAYMAENLTSEVPVSPPE